VRETYYTLVDNRKKTEKQRMTSIPSSPAPVLGTGVKFGSTPAGLSGSLSPRGAMVRLKIPDLLIHRTVKVEDSLTVSEFVNAFLKRNPVQNPELYGLFMLPNDDPNAAYLMKETELMSTFKIQVKVASFFPFYFFDEQL